MLRDLVIDQEDSVDVERTSQAPFDSAHVNVAVVLLPRMSNFTDFKHLAAEDDVRLRYAADPRDLTGADVVIIAPDVSAPGAAEWATSDAGKASIYRLFYVALTRAKHEVHILQPVKPSMAVRLI